MSKQNQENREDANASTVEAIVIYIFAFWALIIVMVTPIVICASPIVIALLSDNLLWLLLFIATFPATVWLFEEVLPPTLYGLQYLVEQKCK